MKSVGDSQFYSLQLFSLHSSKVLHFATKAFIILGTNTVYSLVTLSPPLDGLLMFFSASVLDMSDWGLNLAWRTRTSKVLKRQSVEHAIGCYWKTNSFWNTLKILFFIEYDWLRWTWHGHFQRLIEGVDLLNTFPCDMLQIQGLDSNRTFLGKLRMSYLKVAWNKGSKLSKIQQAAFKSEEVQMHTELFEIHIKLHVCVCVFWLFFSKTVLLTDQRNWEIPCKANPLEAFVVFWVANPFFPQSIIFTLISCFLSHVPLKKFRL